MEESSSFSSVHGDLGRILDGRFRLVERSEVGSFAEVYRATNLSTGGLCTVKILRREFTGVSEIRTCFIRESKLLARLECCRIAFVIDLGEDDGQLFRAMPFLPGETLRAVLAHHRQAPLPWDVGVTLIRDLLCALVALHGEGIVHRDLKPANLMVSTPETCSQWVSC